MDSSTELWLLSDGQEISLLSALCLIRLTGQLPQSTDAPQLESVLPPLAQALEEIKRTRGPVLVHLHTNLPETWQHVPWESLTLGGRKLFGKVIFCRHATLKAPHAAPHTGGLLHVYSLWPDNWQVAGILKPVIAAGRMRLRPADLDWPLQRHGWQDVWGLAIVGHGGDGENAPALDASGAPWCLPQMTCWPRVVFLLACGTHTAMIRQAQAMIARGARTVVVGGGMLDLQASLEGLAELAGNLTASNDLVRQLATLQQRDHRPGGVRRWILCGQSPSDFAHSSLDRLTLLSVAKQGDLSLAPVEWRKSHNKEFGARGEGKLLEELKNTPCWPITSAWSLPQALDLAEIYDPKAQSTLRRKYAALPQTLRALTPHQSDHALARSLRRQGRILPALHALMQAMLEVKPSQLGAGDQLRYLLTLFDLLLDLHLPQSAGRLMQPIHSLMMAGDGSDQCVLEHHWLDRESIWYWREGKLEAAFAKQVLKRDQARDMGEDGYRELARMLWMAGWARLDETPALLAEATSILRTQPISVLNRTGDDDFKYLFQSAALARWRCGFPEKTPTRVRSTLVDTQHNANLDPAPGATAILISAMSRGGAEWPVQLALQRLVDTGYWLEAGFWASVHGQQSHVTQALQRLASAREQAAVSLRGHMAPLESWVGPAQSWLDELSHECEARMVWERATLAPGILPGERGLMF